MEPNTNYEPNSHKYREEKAAREQRKLAPVKLSGAIVKRYKNPLKRFLDIFSMTDTEEVKNYVFYEVLIPAIKDGIYNVIDSSIRMKFFGDYSGGRRLAKSNMNVLDSRFNYTSYANSPRKDPPKPKQEQNRSVFAYEDEAFAMKSDALFVLDTLLEAADQYGIVTVANLYDALGKTATEMDWSYGWSKEDLAKAKVVGDPSHGFYIDFVRPKPIDRMK